MSISKMVRSGDIASEMDLHDLWRRHKKGGKRLVIVGASVQPRWQADGRNLSGAIFRNCIIYGGFYKTNLKGVQFDNCYMRGVEFERCDLSGASFSGSIFRGAWFVESNLDGANFLGSITDSANFMTAQNVPSHLLSITSILPAGDIIGYKKLDDSRFAKLLIPAKAKRSNATGRKCRAEYAVVLDIFDKEGAHYLTGTARYDRGFLYTVGRPVEPTEPYDENIWKECASGIHFFITFEEAERY